MVPSDKNFGDEVQYGRCRKGPWISLHVTISMMVPSDPHPVGPKHERRQKVPWISLDIIISMMDPSDLSPYVTLSFPDD